ncbi:MAG: hypothetical protein HN977_00460 [Gammaproteobacteria bacterium]|nr:hypothetical protein [Gammaproteobacteria bacterium]
MHLQSLGFLVFFFPAAHAWSPEFGQQFSGTGDFDTTGKNFLLIAFNRDDNCHSASMLLDGAIGNHEPLGVNDRVRIKLSVDSNRSWTTLFDLIEFEHWIPHSEALQQQLSPEALHQLGKGKMLSLLIGGKRFKWDLTGSNQAIKSAYFACTE